MFVCAVMRSSLEKSDINLDGAERIAERLKSLLGFSGISLLLRLVPPRGRERKCSEPPPLLFIKAVNQACSSLFSLSGSVCHADQSCDGNGIQQQNSSCHFNSALFNANFLLLYSQHLHHLFSCCSNTVFIDSTVPVAQTWSSLLLEVGPGMVVFDSRGHFCR